MKKEWELYPAKMGIDIIEMFVRSDLRLLSTSTLSDKPFSGNKKGRLLLTARKGSNRKKVRERVPYPAPVQKRTSILGEKPCC
jgi:hypothetical protein